jgi:hypothetical protein
MILPLKLFACKISTNDHPIGKEFFSYLLCIDIIARPNSTAIKIKIVLTNPLTPKDIRIRIVEIMNPEFLIILWN